MDVRPEVTTGAQPSDIARLQDLIDTYWNVAFAEGKEGRDYDTEDGAAQQCRHEINTILKRLAGVQPSDEGQA